MLLVWKSLSYRALSLAVTAVTGWAVTGSLSAAGAVALGDSVVKIGLYAAHEKAWARAGKAGA